MPNRYDRVMTRLPHEYLLRAEVSGPRLVGGAPYVRAQELKPVTEEEIERFERHLGCRLPPDYRAFVRQYGDACFPGGTQLEEADAPGIALFFGLRRNSARALWDQWPPPYPMVPPQCLPIAVSVIEEIVWIALAGDDRGAVYAGAVDAADEVNGGAADPIEPLAESFDSLISGLASN